MHIALCAHCLALPLTGMGCAHAIALSVNMCTLNCVHIEPVIYNYITVMKILVMLSFYISNLNDMYLDRNFNLIVLFNKKMFSARYQAILY